MLTMGSIMTNVSPQPDRYADMLEACGYIVHRINGLNWFEYNGFLRPACLPHCVPLITDAQAREALRASACPFARWDSNLSNAPGSQWWYVLRRGRYDMAQLSGNTRSKIRRGEKRLSARLVSTDELRKQGYAVCRSAVERYDNDAFLPSEAFFQRKLDAADRFPAHLEFYGVFSGDELVAFSENQLQERAVFWESIWYAPKHLGNYSSYLLTHAMLDHYLNLSKLDYVSDGSRSLYHDTQVQSFFVEKFGFEQCPAKMHLEYRWWLRMLIGVLRAGRPVLRALKSRSEVDLLDKLEGLLKQDEIKRACDEL
ncbi:MAG: hypothetical protein ACXIUL_00775 [Wenzhouxiangella sp.]